MLQISVFSLTGSPALAGAAFAARSAKATPAAAHGKRLIATVYRNTPKPRRYTFRLTEPKLRHLAAGRYLVELRAGKTRKSLGPAVSRKATITKAAVKPKGR